MPLYFLSTLIYFWIPILVMALCLWRHQDRLTRKAFWFTLAVFTLLTGAMEYVCLHLDIWSFSEELDPLLGLHIFGAPVEEFMFWFGGAPFVLFIYIGFDRKFRRRGRNT